MISTTIILQKITYVNCFNGNKIIIGGNTKKRKHYAGTGNIKFSTHCRA